MKPSPFAEEQIIGILREQERVPQTREQQRGLLQVGGKYGGLEVSDAKRLKGTRTPS